MFKHVYLCHVFNNTKIKAFLSYCCILCSRIPEDLFGYLTSMQKSSPLNLCSGSNAELNSPTSHIQTWKNRETCTWWLTIKCFIPLFTNFDSTQNNSVEKIPMFHVSIFKTNAFVVIKATQVIFKSQKIIVDTIKIKSCFHPTLAPKVYHSLHYCVQCSTKSCWNTRIKHIGTIKNIVCRHRFLP